MKLDLTCRHQRTFPQVWLLPTPIPPHPTRSPFPSIPSTPPGITVTNSPNKLNRSASLRPSVTTY
ncbi:hypothetical protein E2C01_031017 [Portunus trituberculatus]|uniref:Uncharacterized protein n=1 Tax=Portunus trituberculatus TaxID=210409 RepID=A0A5B7EYY5_PORTR|nr:hypothetical protein [Portunus trituberculatus]